MYEAAAFFGHETLTLFHGSSQVVSRPQFGAGSPFNDYGQGFYCTESQQLASEWACPTLEDGCVNEYALDLSGLSLLDLAAPEYSALNWLAVLLAHRTFEVGPAASAVARDFILQHYGVSLADADLVHGYRADDSYFSFARGFLSNQISLEDLERALFLGGLGYQVVLKTPRAFEALSFVGCATVEGEWWNPLRMARDTQARERYHAVVAQSAEQGFQGTYVVDLMRRA